MSGVPLQEATSSLKDAGADGEHENRLILVFALQRERLRMNCHQL